MRGNIRKCTELVYEFFNEDLEKTYKWFSTYNPLLGCAPNDMIDEGREDKLLKFIINQLNEIKP